LDVSNLQLRILTGQEKNSLDKIDVSTKKDATKVWLSHSNCLFSLLKTARHWRDASMRVRTSQHNLELTFAAFAVFLLERCLLRATAAARLFELLT
jgi:hypothetical protein